jgi:hypothetical protein
MGKTKQIPSAIYNILIDINISEDFREMIAKSIGVEIPQVKKEENIYCPICLETDGLNVALKNLKCPHCSTEYIIKNKKLLIK